jgi:TRAP-type C4-dicarboxylate transport system permease small subunit
LFVGLFWGVVVTFSVMVVSAWLQVVSRYFAKFPLGWTEELSRVMMFWFTYLSVGALIRRRRLMMVDAFVGHLRPRLRLTISGVNSLIAAAALVWLGWLSIDLMAVASGQRSTALQIPYSLIYLSLPLGLAGAVLYLLAVGVADLKQALSSASVDRFERQAND